MPSSDFGVSRNGQPIHDLPAGSSIHTGIGFRVQLRGLVSWFEEFDAMVEARHTPESWERLKPPEKADAVARYRLKRVIMLHENDALESYLRRKALRARKR